MRVGARLQQRGSVSLFIVVFSALLIITMTTAFIRIMLQDQQQATANDLSRSALDSAYAGVEDAKRAIVAYYENNCDKDPNTTACSNLKNLSDPTNVDGTGWTRNCDITEKTHVASLTHQEVLVNTAANDNQFNQAYTCVKVQLDPDSYVGKLKANTSTIIPLQVQDGQSFEKIKIEWYAQQDGSSVDVVTPTPSLPFPKSASASWPQNRPSVIRAQLLQYDKDDGFKLSDFDNAKYNSTLFLYPLKLSAENTTSSFGLESRRTDSAAREPEYVQCLDFSPSDEYACRTTIAAPAPGSSSSNRIAYLNLIQVYSTPTTYRVTLLDASGDSVKFSGVQPVVDSTGRSNDLFRRVQSRITLGTAAAPDATVDITDKLCKTFTVTDTSYVEGKCGS